MTFPSFPLSLALTGNHCGGCCKNTSVRNEIPINYVVVYADDRFIAMPKRKIASHNREHVTATVYARLQERLKSVYSIDWDELAAQGPIVDLIRPQSVADVHRIEAAAAKLATSKLNSSLNRAPRNESTESSE